MTSTKTPEQMAEEWANGESDLWFADISTYTDGHKSAVKQGFLAGYQAAKELYAAKLKEANDTVAGMADECEGLKTIIYDYDETNLLTPAKWISVQDRLPSCGVLCAWISDTTQSCIARIEVDDMHPWYEGFDYWCELPEAPKGEG